MSEVKSQNEVSFELESQLTTVKVGPVTDFARFFQEETEGLMNEGMKRCLVDGGGAPW